jgi:mono/diheme cytochrome c family protein
MLRTITLTAVFVFVATATWAADGAAVYKTHCAKCHGDTGKAESAAGKAMKVPAFDAKVGAMSADEIVAKVKANAKHATVMKAVGDDDLAAAAAHVKELAK